MANNPQRSWCWTYWLDRKCEEIVITKPQAEIDTICNHIRGLDVRYSAYALEKSKEGLRHLQGYTEFKKPQRMAAVKKLFECESLHLEKRKGSREQAREYCRGFDSPICIVMTNDGYTVSALRKAGVIGMWEAGTWENGGQGSRFQGILEECQGGATVTDIMDNYPAEYIKYSTGIEKMVSKCQERNIREERKVELEKIILYPWEKRLLDEIKFEDPRAIYWYWEKEGNCGKSTFTNWLDFIKGAFTWNGPCVNKDIASAIDSMSTKPSLYVFDFTRQRQDYIDYSIMESIKNGKISVNKYCSHNIYLPVNSQVVCFANWKPDTSSMSLDRWKIREISALTKGIVTETVYTNGNRQELTDMSQLANSQIV